MVEVEWLDAGFENANLSIEEAKNLTPMKRTNCGYLIKKDKDKVILAFGKIYDSDHQVSVLDGSLVIPRSWVVKITQL